MKKYPILFIIAICFITAMGCTTTKVVNPLKIDRVNWIIHNMPQGFFQNWNSEDTCAMEFTIVYSGDVKEGDILTAGFSNKFFSNQFIMKDNVDYSKKMIGLKNGWFTMWSTEPYNGNTFCIGQTTFWFKTKSGIKYEYSMDIPEPGESSSNGNEMVFTEDYQYGSKTWLNNWNIKIVPCLKRPIVNSVRKQNTNIEIEFTLDDMKFYSGGVVFYNKARETIAGTKPFHSYQDGANEKYINDGNGIHNDGIKNVVTLNLDELSYFRDGKPQDVVGFYLLVTDGYQYAETSHSYDSISYSKRTEL